MEFRLSVNRGLWALIASRKFEKKTKTNSFTHCIRDRYIWNFQTVCVWCTIFCNLSSRYSLCSLCALYTRKKPAKITINTTRERIIPGVLKIWISYRAVGFRIFFSFDPFFVFILKKRKNGNKTTVLHHTACFRSRRSLKVERGLQTS